MTGVVLEKAAPNTAQQGRLGLASLIVTFARIGVLAFGGLGAALALIERELVQSRRVLTEEDVAEALTYTKLLPGSTVIQVVSYLGWRLGGWPGSAAATVAFILPAFVLMVLLAALYGLITSVAAVAPALQGLLAAVVGVLLATLWRLGRANVRTAPGLAVAAGAFALSAFAEVNPAVLVVAAGLLGILLGSRLGGEEKASKGKKGARA